MPRKRNDRLTCGVAACDLPQHCGGYCAAHYSRWKRSGDVDADRPIGYYRDGGFHQRKRKSEIARYEQRKAWLDAYKLERGCIDCGYREHPAALDLDHRPGEVKTIRAFAAMISANWDRFCDEIEKCDVRCANCHRVKTVERWAEAHASS